jgi:hypothetical protein
MNFLKQGINSDPSAAPIAKEVLFGRMGITTGKLTAHATPTSIQSKF